MVHATDMARYSLTWRNPCTEPPEGQPRTLKALLVRRGEKCPQEITDLHVPGGGYCVAWELVTQQPIRRWSQEAKSRARRRNLRQRLEKRFPLFASIFEADELARRPEYFAAEDVAK